MESIYMLGRAAAIILVLIIAGYGLFIRPKQKDAPKRMSGFQYVMKKRRERQEAEARVRAGTRNDAATRDDSRRNGTRNDEPAEEAHLTMAQQQRRTGEKKVRK